MKIYAIDHELELTIFKDKAEFIKVVGNWCHPDYLKIVAGNDLSLYRWPEKGSMIVKSENNIAACNMLHGIYKLTEYRK